MIRSTFTAFALCAFTSALAVADPVPTSLPSIGPTTAPTSAPTTVPTTHATTIPAYATTVPSASPTSAATTRPTKAPIGVPTIIPGTPPPLAHVATITYHQPTTPALAAPWLTYDYSGGQAQAQAEQLVGIRQIVYMNPFLPQVGDFEYAVLNGSGLQAKTCAGSAITFQNGIMADAISPAIFPYLTWAISSELSTHPNADVVFVDNYNDLYGLSGMPCSFTTYPAWSSALFTAMNLQQPSPLYWVNTLSVPLAFVSPPPGLTTANQLSALPPAVNGAELEYCFENSPVNGKISTGATWVAMLQTEAATIAAGKTFVCDVSGTWSSQWAASVASDRLYVYASFLLGYNPYDAAYQEFLHSSSGFNVYPETGFVAMAPTSAYSVDASGLYVRTFSACYFRAQPLGPCIVAVNPSTTAAPFTYAQTYPYAMALSGGSVLDSDAWVGFAGAVPASVLPGSAVIAIEQPAAPMGAVAPSPIPSP